MAATSELIIVEAKKSLSGITTETQEDLENSCFYPRPLFSKVKSSMSCSAEKGRLRVHDHHHGDIMEQGLHPAFAVKAFMNSGSFSFSMIFGAMPPPRYTPPVAMSLRARFPASAP